MTILMVAIIEPHGTTAGKTHFLALCNHFASHGHTVLVMLPRIDEWKAVEEKYAPIGIRFLWVTPLASPTLEWLFLGWWRTIQLAATLVKSQPDVLYIRCRTSCPFLSLVAKLMRPKLRIISEHPGWVSYQLRVCNAPAWQQRLAEWSQLMNARFATRVRAIAPGIATALSQKGIPADRIFVAATGTDTTLFHPIPRDEALAKTGLSSNNTYIGFVGLVERWQGLDCLLPAAAPFLNDHPTTKLLIVGSGPCLAEIKQQAHSLGIAEQCIFTGRVPHDITPYYINTFTLGILFKYGLDNISNGLYASMKLRDYAACGIPILASDGAQDNAIVEQAQIGRLVNIAIPSEITKALTDLLSDHTALDQMGKQARALAEKTFSWSRVGDCILEQMKEDYD